MLCPIRENAKEHSCPIIDDTRLSIDESIRTRISKSFETKTSIRETGGTKSQWEFKSMILLFNDTQADASAKKSSKGVTFGGAIRLMHRDETRACE
jgi:hypothetical protein